MKNHYYTLGISSDATVEEIKQAYLKLAIKFHPDNNNNDLFFAEHFKKIDEAFEILFDKEKRKHYDLLINNEQISERESNFTENLGNGITLDMIFVEGGTFMMGSDDGRDDERPIHSVTLDSFWIGKFQVTQAQWKAIMGHNHSYHKGDNLSVEQVRWDYAQKFIKEINHSFPSLGGKGKYRLLTEAEWEYAARGGNKSKGYEYAGSNNINEVAWYRENSWQTHPVGQKKANELGIFDMSGNVSEWCEDWYDRDYYKNSPSKNPQGASSGSARVYRGGGWDGFSTFCRVADRLYDPPEYRGINLGFRVCRSK